MRQRVRRLLLIVSFLFFPLFIFYFSPYLIVMGAFEGVLAGSAVVFSLQFLTALFAGRALCGWFCPAGQVQDLASMVNGKPSKLGWRRRVKYVVWVAWFAAIVAGFWLAGGVSSVEMLYHTQGGISVGDVMSLFIYLGIVVLFFVPSLFWGRRAMCHYICWMAPFMVLGEKLGRALQLPQANIKADAGKCIACGRCTKACPMSLDVQGLLKEGGIRDAECIQCAECADVCPKDALRLSFSRVKGAS